MEELTYEQAMLKLENIVEILEKGETSLEDSLNLFEEGTKLATFCNNALNAAEQKIVQTTGEDGVN